MKFEADGCEVTRIGFDHAVWLYLENAMVIQLSTNVTVLSPSGEAIRLGAGNLGSGALLLLSQLHQIVRSLLSTESGSLLIEFDDGSRWTIDPDDDYEAWSVNGADGSMVISTPGGDLAIWS